MTGIYKITSPSGKVYIGSSKDINRRKEDYRYKRCRSFYMLVNKQYRMYYICINLKMEYVKVGMILNF